jgi:hypothetical protein
VEPLREEKVGSAHGYWVGNGVWLVDTSILLKTLKEVKNEFDLS